MPQESSLLSWREFGPNHFLDHPIGGAYLTSHSTKSRAMSKRLTRASVRMQIGSTSSETTDQTSISATSAYSNGPNSWPSGSPKRDGLNSSLPNHAPVP